MKPLAILGTGLVAPPAPGDADLVIRSAQGKMEQVGVREFLAERVPKRMLRRMTRLATMVVGGALRALEAAGYGDPASRAGIGSVFGTAYGEITVACRIFEGGLDSGISPTAFHNSVHNAALGYLGIFAGLRGPSLAISDSTISGEESVCEAASLITAGEAHVVVVGAGDESCPSMFSPCWVDGEDAPRCTAREGENGAGGVVTDEGCGFMVVRDAEMDPRDAGEPLALVRDIRRGPGLEDLVGRTGATMAPPDAVILPAGPDRTVDRICRNIVTRVLGEKPALFTEGSFCGYVPAAGIIRCVMAVDLIRSGMERVLVVGRDLDGHAATVVLEAPVEL